MAAEISGDHSRNAKAEMVRTVTASIYLTERETSMLAIKTQMPYVKIQS